MPQIVKPSVVVQSVCRRLKPVNPCENVNSMLLSLRQVLFKQTDVIRYREVFSQWATISAADRLGVQFSLPLHESETVGRQLSKLSQYCHKNT